MNTVLLQYALEVEKTGSITQAAHNLYMDQPNLSKAIKSLEESLGAPIFQRSPKGMVPTGKGKLFLEYARSILAQLEEMEALYKPGTGTGLRFAVSIPRASYISHAFSRFACGLDREEGMELWLKETSSTETIEDVMGRDYQIGIIRFRKKEERYFRQLLAERDMAYMPVWEYDPLLLMSGKHPLAGRDEITAADLKEYVEIAHGDTGRPAGSMEGGRWGEEERPPKRIYVFERGSQFGLLSMDTDTYMWVSPLPGEIIEKQGFVQRACRGADRRQVDLLIYPRDYHLNSLDQRFLEELETVRQELMSAEQNAENAGSLFGERL